MTMRLLLAAALGLSLGACGNDPDAGFGFKTISAYVKGRLAGNRTTQPQQVVLTPEILAGIDSPLLYAKVEQSGGAATLGAVARNGDAVTWSTADGRTISLRNGLLVATRGLGGDLLSADVAPLQAAMSAGGGSYTRAFEHLDGENQVAALETSCTLTREGRQTIDIVGNRYDTLFYREICNDESGQATNQYWVEPGTSTVRQSRQWVSPTIGMLFVQQVID